MKQARYRSAKTFDGVRAYLSRPQCLASRSCWEVKKKKKMMMQSKLVLLDK